MLHLVEHSAILFLQYFFSAILLTFVKAIIGFESQFVVFLRVAVLHRLLWLFQGGASFDVYVLSCFHVCSLHPCGHLLGKS